MNVVKADIWKAMCQDWQVEASPEESYDHRIMGDDVSEALKIVPLDKTLELLAIVESDCCDRIGPHSSIRFNIKKDARFLEVFVGSPGVSSPQFLSKELVPTFCQGDN